MDYVTIEVQNLSLTDAVSHSIARLCQLDFSDSSPLVIERVTQSSDLFLNNSELIIERVIVGRIRHLANTSINDLSDIFTECCELLSIE